MIIDKDTYIDRLRTRDRSVKGEGFRITAVKGSHKGLSEYLPMLCQLLESNEQVMQKILENTKKNEDTEKNENTEKNFIPLWEKRLLTLEEASVLFGIGMNRLRLLSDDDNCTFVLWNQSRRLIKREQLEKYIEKTYSI